MAMRWGSFVVSRVECPLPPSLEISMVFALLFVSNPSTGTVSPVFGRIVGRPLIGKWFAFFSSAKSCPCFFKELLLNGSSLGFFLSCAFFSRAKRNKRIKTSGWCPSPILPIARYSGVVLYILHMLHVIILATLSQQNAAQNVPRKKSVQKPVANPFFELHFRLSSATVKLQEITEPSSKFLPSRHQHGGFFFSASSGWCSSLIEVVGGRCQNSPSGKSWPRFGQRQIPLYSTFPQHKTKTYSVQQGAHDATCPVCRPLSRMFTKELKATLRKPVRSGQVSGCAWCNMESDRVHVHHGR